MTITRQQFAQDALLSLSKPVSEANIQSLVIWQTSEGTSAENNPCATTLRYENSTEFNSAGVQNYPSYQDGIQAWKLTILNGLYGAILSCFDQSASPAETCSTIENSPWGSKPSSQLVADVLADFSAYANTAIGGSGNETDPGTNPNPVPEPQQVLQIGSVGPQVGDVQNFFNVLCGQHLIVDDHFGELTKLAVQNFQRFFGLTIDGIVGPQTWATIDYVRILHGQ